VFFSQNAGNRGCVLSVHLCVASPKLLNRYISTLFGVNLKVTPVPNHHAVLRRIGDMEVKLYAW